MVSKISQGGYGTVYRGVLETWLLRSVDFFLTDLVERLLHFNSHPGTKS